MRDTTPNFKFRALRDLTPGPIQIKAGDEFQARIKFVLGENISVIFPDGTHVYLTDGVDVDAVGEL